MNPTNYMNYSNFNIARIINLHYRSDGDDFWREWVSTGRFSPGPITYGVMTRLTGRAPFDPNEKNPRDLDDFFDLRMNAQPEDAARYDALRFAIHGELLAAAVFRMRGAGSNSEPFNLAIYVVGRDANGTLAGITVLATET